MSDPPPWFKDTKVSLGFFVNVTQRDAMKEMRAQRAAERLVRDTTDSGRRIQGAGRHSHGTSSASSSKAQSEDEDADKVSISTFFSFCSRKNLKIDSIQKL